MGATFLRIGDTELLTCTHATVLLVTCCSAVCQWLHIFGWPQQFTVGPLLWICVRTQSPPSYHQVHSTQQTILEMAASLFAQRPTSTPMLESYLALSVFSQDKVTWLFNNSWPVLVDSVPICFVHLAWLVIRPKLVVIELFKCHFSSNALSTTNWIPVTSVDLE